MSLEILKIAVMSLEILKIVAESWPIAVIVIALLIRGAIGQALRNRHIARITGAPK